MFLWFGTVAFCTWVDLGALLLCNALGRPPTWSSVAALRLSGPEGYLHCGSDLVWVGCGAPGTLERCTGFLRERTGAGLQWEWRHWCCVFVPSPGHTRHQVCVACSLSPSSWRTGVTRGLDYTRGPSGLTVLSPRSHQSPARPSQTASCSVRRFPARLPHPASSLVLSARATFLCPATRPKSSTDV